MELLTDPNELVGKAYNKDTYHCWSFIEECLDVPRLNSIAVDMAKESVDEYKQLFIKLEIPCNYCLVLLGDSHIGIYFDGGVYHNDRDMVKYEYIRSLKRKYAKINYYDKG